MLCALDATLTTLLFVGFNRCPDRVFLRHALPHASVSPRPSVPCTAVQSAFVGCIHAQRVCIRPLAARWLAGLAGNSRSLAKTTSSRCRRGSHTHILTGSASAGAESSRRRSDATHLRAAGIPGPDESPRPSLLQRQSGFSTLHRRVCLCHT